MEHSRSGSEKRRSSARPQSGNRPASGSTGSSPPLPRFSALPVPLARPARARAGAPVAPAPAQLAARRPRRAASACDPALPLGVSCSAAAWRLCARRARRRAARIPHSLAAPARPAASEPARSRCLGASWASRGCAPPDSRRAAWCLRRLRRPSAGAARARSPLGARASRTRRRLSAARPRRSFRPRRPSHRRAAPRSASAR